MGLDPSPPPLVVISTTQPARLGTSDSVDALEVCLKGRIGSVAAFDEAHGTVRVDVDYEVNGDVWTHSQLEKIYMYIQL